MKIVDIKTKIIPSNPRSKNYPIGYPGGIASNSNGVTPDLSIYLLKEIWERNFEERTDEYGNEYLYIRKPLAIGGGATMYASNGVVVPSIFDGLPLDNQTIWKNPTTGKIEVIGGSGSSFDENAMWSALSGSSDNQINKSHLTTALDGYATQNWVIENYATKSELSAVSNKLNDFLEGSDTDNIINKWKELEAFLSGMAETDNLAEILETKADKKYVDSTFVTLGTKQTITGEKTFTSVLNTAAIKASGAITAPSLAASDWVTIAGIKLRKLEDGALILEGNLALTGALTMYATGAQGFDTIYDGLPIDNDTIYWSEVEGSKVLKAKEGSGSSFDKSAMWAALEGATTEQINKTHLTTALNGYATESWVTSKNYLTSVSIATISDLHANWDALLKAAPSAYVTRWPTISEVTDRKNLIIKLNGGSTEGTNLFTYNVTGEKTINITPAGIGAAASSHNHSWSNITSGKPSTLSGYGITDAYTKTESDNKYPTKTGSGASGTWGISITGNAGSSTKLQTAQKIWGQLFDGTKPVTGALTSVTDITGTGTFSAANLKATDSVYVNGIRLHKTADGVIILEGSLAVTGGVTMYAIDPVSASTIMDGVVVDGTTIKKENGKLVAVGGGEAGSVAWGNISGKPSVFATNIANITDLHSSWDAVLAAQKPAWLTAVSIATISDLNSGWDALLKAAPSTFVTRWPTISEVTNKQSLIVKLNGGTTEGTNQFTYNATAAKTINITASSIGAAASSHNHSWSNITSGKPTTLAGYGITDAPTKTGSGASGTWGINVTGNAGSSTKLQTAQKIWGQSFDGTGNVSGNLDSVGNITLNRNAIIKGSIGGSDFWKIYTKEIDTSKSDFIIEVGDDMDERILCRQTYWNESRSPREITLMGYRGEQRFIDVYINGIRLHKTADGVITLEGNLAVTGGVTTYAIDPVSASTIMDGVVVDGTTIKKENGKLVAVGGGEAGSVAWGNISGKPSVFATNIANITDLHSSWDSVLAAQKPAWLTAVSIATISDLNSGWDALLKAAPSAYVTRWPTISEITNKQNLIVKLNGGTTEGTNQFTYNATGAKTINITPAGIGAAASSHNHSWSNITSGKPTTLAGYGITDAPTKTGSGASGTWGINISGNASNADKIDNAHNGDLTARYLNTISYTSDLSSFKYNGISAWSTNSSNRPADYGVLFQFSNVGDPSPGTNGHWVNQIAYGTNARLYTRQRINAADWTTWKTIAFLDDNVASATKLRTPRQLWGNDFDGTAPVNGRIYASNGIYLPYGRDINNEYGNVLRTNYDSNTGGDYFELTAIGANKRKVSLIGLNYGELLWEGSRFVLGVYGGGWYMDNSDWIKSQNNKGIYTGGNILSGGGCTFYGSDIRYKYIVQHVQLLALNKIAEAPSFVYRWNRPNMNQNRLNLGGSAQYTQTILPWAVEDNDNFLSMDYATVAYTFAVHTARHLMRYETRTDKKIKKLEREIVILKKRLKLGYEEVRTLDDSGI